MNNYWLHRISHSAELSYPLLEKGFLTIGFSDLTSPNTIDYVLSGDWKNFDESFQRAWGFVPKTRHNLAHFLKMKKGDIVVVPSWKSFYICEITDECPLLIGETFSDDLVAWGDRKVYKRDNHLVDSQSNVFDLGFARKVNVLYSSIPREKFADAKLTSRMKIRQTNAQINDLKESVQKSIENFKQNKPIHLHSIIIEATADTVIQSIKNELNPDKFEKLITLYFRKIGADEVFIPSKNGRGKDGDADITAIFEKLKLIIYTQAKFHKGQTNELATNQVLDYKANKENIADGYNKIAWVITTADRFNDNAENLAKENAVQLINGIEFAKMLLNVGIDILDTDL